MYVCVKAKLACVSLVFLLFLTFPFDGILMQIIADIECDDTMVCNRSAKNDRPHLFGVGAPLEVSEKNVTFNLLYHDAQSVSHNVGIWVWGAYQVS